MKNSEAITRGSKVAGSRGSRTIVFLAAPKTQILDVAGPFQVFVRAAELFVLNELRKERPYEVVLASTTDDGRRISSVHRR